MSRDPVPHGSLTVLRGNVSATLQGRDLSMLDILYIVIGLGIFGVLAAYVRGLRGI